MHTFPTILRRAWCGQHVTRNVMRFSSIPQSFEALWTETSSSQKGAKSTVRTTELSELMPGDVTVQVEYSSVNYKDALALRGLPGVVKQYPMICGIDFAGSVLDSSIELLSPGEKVILTGWGVGEKHYGGFSQVARVKKNWLIPCPHDLTTKQAMTVGTAGLTAALCILDLKRANISPEDSRKNPVVVTGAGGGVGSVAIALLSSLGYHVVAVSGRKDDSKVYDMLTGLGALDVINRDDLITKARLGNERFCAGIDTAGGDMLSSMLAQIKYNGAVAACGLARSHKLETTVFPFILRGVHLLGVDSVYCRWEKREEAWNLISNAIDKGWVDEVCSVIKLSDLASDYDGEGSTATQVLKGHTRGRIVVDVNQT